MNFAINAIAIFGVLVIVKLVYNISKDSKKSRLILEELAK
jgi:hypothetical protein